jgi:hypothetical protein
MISKKESPNFEDEDWEDVGQWYGDDDADYEEDDYGDWDEDD